MKYTHDYMSCPSNICETDPDKHLRNWYVDEAICSFHPVSHWMKVQRKLHNHYLQGKMDKSNMSFTIKQLNKIKYGGSSSMGTVSDPLYKIIRKGKISSYIKESTHKTSSRLGGVV